MFHLWPKVKLSCPKQPPGSLCPWAILSSLSTFWARNGEARDVLLSTDSSTRILKLNVIPGSFFQVLLAWSV